MRIQEFDFSVDLLQALLWEYNSATSLQVLLETKSVWYTENQQEFWLDWYNDVFNLVTCNAFGMAVWSVILGLPLFLIPNPDPPDKPIFGFNEDPSINTYVNFGNGNFSSLGSTFGLTLEEQRLVLRLRYYQLVSRGAIPDTNKFLKELFGDQGTAFELDGLDMTIIYVFNFEISNRLLAILRYYDILPRPAGVKLRFIVIAGIIYGFNEIPEINNYANFEGNFFPGER